MRNGPTDISLRQFCPKCLRRSFRFGKCLQCGNRVTGVAQLGTKERHRKGNPPIKWRPDLISGESNDSDFMSIDYGDVGGGDIAYDT
jgi:hypothetical protein